MQSILETLQNKTYETTKATSERASLVEKFVKTLNMERSVENWKRYNRQKKANPDLTKEEFKKMKLPIAERYFPDYTPAQVGVKLAHVETGYLYTFYKECSTAKCGFSKAFNGSLKVK